MARTTPLHRIDRAWALFDPRHNEGSFLLERYLRGVELDRNRTTQEHEVWLFRELLRMVSELGAEHITLDALTHLTNRPGLTPTAVRRRRTLVWRLWNLLASDGIFPTRAEVRANRRIQATIASVPEPTRDALRRWLAYRHERVGWHQLAWEAQHLRELLHVRASMPVTDLRDVIGTWIAQIVRPVANCRHATVTRRTDGSCSKCNATVSSHGQRPSPDPRKQLVLVSIARKFFAYCGEPVPEGA